MGMRDRKRCRLMRDLMSGVYDLPRLAERHRMSREQLAA